ncbi:DUF1493 family protein [Pantoea vagans]|uniref:DUF1493 family protein n=1 Tax=Pantoea vagans TaxID=470934 RepID=UPI0028991369|nr:DUF1493 family protein [Pantoea vagans]
MNDLSHAIIALIEYHNQPTALGGFRKVDRAGFYLQQLPLNEVEFAILMNDFFATFNVCSEHYDDARYFPAAHSRLMTLMKRFKSGEYCPVTVAMLCEAASRGRWPEAGY